MQVKALLATVQQELIETMGGSERAARWVKPENSHVTLQFLGDTPIERIAEVETAIRAACQVAPFRLRVRGLGLFPGVRRPRVIWAGLHGSREDIDALTLLQSSISASMGALGFKPDKQFRAHITLARIREGADKADLEDIAVIFRDPQSQPFFESEFAVAAVSLMQSLLQGGGPVYSQIAHVSLGQKL